MRKGKDTMKHTAAELKANRGESRTDWHKADAVTDEELKQLIAEDEGECDLRPDWTRAELVTPQARQSVHLRLERDVIEFFRSQGKGHISRMQAVLKAYVEANSSRRAQ